MHDCPKGRTAWSEKTKGKNGRKRTPDNRTNDREESTLVTHGVVKKEAGEKVAGNSKRRKRVAGGIESKKRGDRKGECLSKLDRRRTTEKGE